MCVIEVEIETEETERQGDREREREKTENEMGQLCQSLLHVQCTSAGSMPAARSLRLVFTGTGVVTGNCASLSFCILHERPPLREAGFHRAGRVLGGLGFLDPKASMFLNSADLKLSRVQEGVMYKDIKTVCREPEPCQH